MITIYGLKENGTIFGFSFTENFNDDIEMYSQTPIVLEIFSTTEDRFICYNLVDYFTYLKDGGTFKTLNEFSNQELVNYELTQSALVFLSQYN